MRDGIGKLPTPDSHVDGENGVKTMVYNTKRNSKRKTREKTEERKKGWRNTTVKRNNSKLLITLLGHDQGCFFALLHMQFLPLNTNNRYLFSRFRLAFLPTLYKFIVRAYWAWVYSCFGVRVKTSPYTTIFAIYCNENFKVIFYCNDIFIAITWYQLFYNLLQWQT